MAKTPPKYNHPLDEPKATKTEAKKLPVNLDLLSDEARERITDKARAQVEADAIFAAEEAFLEQEKKRLEKLANPEAFEEQRTITLDLALYADRIVLDGVHYMHGQTYTIPKSKYDVMMEIVQHTMRHEDEINRGSEYDKFYRRERNKTLNWRTGAAREADGRPVRF